MAVKKRDLYLDIRKNVPAKERKRLGITAKTPKKRLMEIIEAEKMTGSGIFDFITKPIGKFFGPREDFNNITSKTLKEYGDAPIQSMYIMRAPITGAINTALNIVSLGAWNRVRKEANYDKLFHLSLVCDVRKDNQVVPIILEKNEVVNISSSFKKYPGFETMPIPLPQGTAQSDFSTKVRRAGPPKILTIRQLVENALKGVGRKTFFEYDAFNNNCQFFIMYLLQYSGLLSAKAKGFIYQPMEEVVKKIPGFVPKMARMLTDLAASWNKLSGQGKTEMKGCGITANDRHNLDLITDAMFRRLIRTYFVREEKKIATDDGLDPDDPTVLDSKFLRTRIYSLLNTEVLGPIRKRATTVHSETRGPGGRRGVFAQITNPQRTLTVNLTDPGDVDIVADVMKRKIDQIINQEIVPVPEDEWEPDMIDGLPEDLKYTKQKLPVEPIIHTPAMFEQEEDAGPGPEEDAGPGPEMVAEGKASRGGQTGFSPAGISKGSKNRQVQEEATAKDTLINFVLDSMFEAGQISGNELRNAKVNAQNESRKKAEERVNALKAQNPDKTFEQLRQEALERYEQTPRGQMEKAQREAEAEEYAERVGQQIRAREQAKFQKENPFLASILDFGRITAPITTEALKYVLSAVPGLPPQIRDGLNKGLNLMRNIAMRDDVREGRLDFGKELSKVLEGDGLYGGEKKAGKELMKQLKAYALGDNDVQEKLPTDTKIILYNDLAGVEDITELMDEKGRLVMLYPREAPTVGHWVCMFINKEGDIEYFDPYGEPPEETKRDLSPEKLEELGIVEDILMPLLKQSASRRGKGVVFNAHQYQKLAPGINTCGRWCVSRLAFHEATADEFKKILDEMKKGTNKSYDDIVSILTEI